MDTVAGRFNLKDLGMAYRKAKVDLFYTTHPSLSELVVYEENLEENLSSLLHRINGESEDWIDDEQFLGGWIPAPAKLGWQAEASRAGDAVFSSPRQQWGKYLNQKSVSPGAVATFRVMARNSVDFHILSALWIIHVGEKFDVQLSDVAYGNRVRRQTDKTYNKLSLGSFQPYLKPYRDWRDNGLKAMRSALESKKRIVAVSADITSFYHCLNPAFMLGEQFIKLAGVKLTPLETRLHRLFIESLTKWSEHTPLDTGLPVGLPASAIVANIALIALDQIMEKEVVPLYYGRYVDDILLVIENHKGFATTAEVWKWLIDRSNNQLKSEDSDLGGAVRFAPDYLNGSSITFSDEKTRLFIMEGRTGLSMLQSIEGQIGERASEWRSLPNLPDSAEKVTTEVVEALTQDGERANSLQNTDSVTTRKAAFAIKLRDFEAYERDLPANVWAEQRHALFDAFLDQVMVPHRFFDMAGYYPRIIRLATACADFEHLDKLIRALNKLVEEVSQHCGIGLKATSPPMDMKREVLDKWADYLESMLQECIFSAFPAQLSRQQLRVWNQHFAKKNVNSGDRRLLSSIAGLSISKIRKENERYFVHDLAYKPFRYLGLPAELIKHIKTVAKKAVTYVSKPLTLVDESIHEGLEVLAQWSGWAGNTVIPYGLVFATRPFTLIELYLIADAPFSKANQQVLSSAILAQRGFSVTDKLAVVNKKGVLDIEDGGDKEKVRIALANFLTEEDSWIASITRRPDPDAGRYQRLMTLLENVIEEHKSIDYLLMPEVSLPPVWFMRLAHKLSSRRISLIAGIEYIHARRKAVRNQVWSALTHNGFGFPSHLVYMQDKQTPAFHEETELKRIGGVTMRPAVHWPGGNPPIIQHGGFFFSILVCSELTNISYRSAIRGKVDALFVPEWNPDTDSFNALVESAALDVHAYILQCNHRQYGDSRIRAPYKKSWMRDLVRIKGGILDYFVVGEIDIKQLRRFQSPHRSPSGPFKPVPDGFSISFERETLPL
tara:strand:- start:23277 stop:26294 length:3018 start_codon:yes stop_codon:yes gene_type:complete